MRVPVASSSNSMNSVAVFLMSEEEHPIGKRRNASTMDHHGMYRR